MSAQDRCPKCDGWPEDHTPDCPPDRAQVDALALDLLRILDTAMPRNARRQLAHTLVGRGWTRTESDTK